MTSIKMAALALAALSLAGCATPPLPPIATHTFAILTIADGSGLTDKATLAELQAHPLWLPQHGDLRGIAVATIAQRLTDDPKGWRMVPAIDVSLLALVAAHHDDGSTFVDELGAPRPGVDELLERLGIDAVFVVAEQTLAKGPVLAIGTIETRGGKLMGWEQLTVAYFDRTRPPGEQAGLVQQTTRIIDTPTPEGRAGMLNEFDLTRRLLEEQLHLEPGSVASERRVSSVADLRDVPAR